MCRGSTYCITGNVRRPTDFAITAGTVQSIGSGELESTNPTPTYLTYLTYLTHQTHQTHQTHLTNLLT